MAATGEDGTQLDLGEVEAELRARQADVSTRIAALTKPPEGGSGVQFGKRVGDGTTEAIGRFTDFGVANDLDKISDRIERALAKLAEGTYGECDGCGGTIATGRLRAAPESALCVECARAER
jgi:DnaK suppressor protein